MVQRGEILLDNGLNPSISVASIAKQQLSAGSLIEKGIGSMQIRGEAIRIAEHPDHVPAGLLSQVHVKRNVEPGQIITFDDVEIPDTLAYAAWRETLNNISLPKVHLKKEEKTFKRVKDTSVQI